MEGSYPVFMGGETVGRVQVTRQGLYYRFAGRCQLSAEVMCRLQVTCGQTVRDLGIFVQEGNCFVLSARVPVKQLGGGKPQFCIKPHHRPMEGLFVPVSPEEPFAYLSRVKAAYLENRGGVTGLVIPENSGGQG